MNFHLLKHFAKREKTRRKLGKVTPAYNQSLIQQFIDNVAVLFKQGEIVNGE